MVYFIVLYLLLYFDCLSNRLLDIIMMKKYALFRDKNKYWLMQLLCPIKKLRFVFGSCLNLIRSKVKSKLYIVVYTTLSATIYKKKII